MSVAAAVPTKGSAASTSPWLPLSITVFRWLWIAGLVSNVGTFMRIVGAAWLMTSLSDSPAVIALIQTATALPAVCLSLLAGALADVVDRRKLLLATQGSMVVLTAALGLLTQAHMMTPALLLVFIVALGVASTLNLPAWMALTPEVVPRKELPASVALNSVSINTAQALGPALGGLIVAGLGVEWVFLLNAVTFVGVLTVIARWKRERSHTSLPAEHIATAMRTGARYVMNAPNFQIVLARAGVFIFFSSAIPALLPVLARQRLLASAGQFGLLQGSLGAGAVATALLLPRIRARVGVDVLVVAASGLVAALLVLLSLTTQFAVVMLLMFLAGSGSITVMSSLNIVAQNLLPGWVRGRGLAVFFLLFQGATASGAVVWGALATNAGLPLSFATAGIISAAMLALTSRLKLAHCVEVDNSSLHWPEPHILLDHNPDDGPVVVSVEWRVQATDVPDFARAMSAVRHQRLRDGGMQWGLYQDVEDPGRMIETYMLASWAEHEREQERVTGDDFRAQEPARALLVPGTTPVATHLLATHASRHHHLLHRSRKHQTSGEPAHAEEIEVSS